MDTNRTAPYTTRELANEAGVTDRYIRQLVRDGKLTGQKLGPLWTINADVAQAWLKERRSRGEKF